MLEDASRAQRTKIAKRKEELRKLGVKYDFKGDFLKQITDKQLEGLGLLGDQARGSASPGADLSVVPKAVMYEPWILVTPASLSGSPRMPPLLRVCQMRARMRYDCERYI